MSDPELIAITQQHRAQQLLIRRSVMTNLAAIMPRLDWTRLDATYPDFMLEVGAMVRTHRDTSSDLTSAYLRAMRSASSIPGEVATVFADPLNAEQFDQSLRYNTVTATKKAAARGISPDVAMANALTLTQGVATRFILNGSRETAIRTLQSDSAAYGFQRITASGACGFCRMLASRGATYKKDTADFGAHNNCGCSTAPVYGGKERQVKAFIPSERGIPQADKDRAKAWIKANFE